MSAEKPRPIKTVSHIFVLADRGYDDFQVMLCSGFDEMTVCRFGNMPCTVELRLSHVKEVRHFDKLDDVPGLQEACSLALRIRMRPGPLKARPHLSTSKMPPSDRIRRAVCRAIFPHREHASGMPPLGRGSHSDRVATLRMHIKLHRHEARLKTRIDVSGFKKRPCSHLRNSVMFPEIKQFVKRWGFDTGGTIFADGR